MTYTLDLDEVTAPEVVIEDLYKQLDEYHREFAELKQQLRLRDNETLADAVATALTRAEVAERRVAALLPTLREYGAVGWCVARMSDPGPGDDYHKEARTWLNRMEQTMKAVSQ